MTKQPNKPGKRRIETPEDIEALVLADMTGQKIDLFDRDELRYILERQLKLVKAGIAPEAALRQAAGDVLRQNQTPKRRITSLGEIELRVLDVTVYREGDNGEEAWQFTLRELPRALYFELARRVPDPVPVKKQNDPIDIMRVNGLFQRLYDIDEREYLEAQNRAASRRAMLRLLYGLVDFDVPGETDEEKIDALEAALPMDIANALIEAQNTFVAGSEARIEERAKRFHSARDDAAVDAGPKRVGTRKVPRAKPG